MALGWCMSCETLRAIRPASLRLGSRECEWRPIAHDVARHVACKSVVETSEDGTRTCRKCGPLTDDESVMRVPCDGDQRDIR